MPRLPNAGAGLQFPGTLSAPEPGTNGGTGGHGGGGELLLSSAEARVRALPWVWTIPLRAVRLRVSGAPLLSRVPADGQDQGQDQESAEPAGAVRQHCSGPCHYSVGVGRWCIFHVYYGANRPVHWDPVLESAAEHRPTLAVAVSARHDPGDWPTLRLGVRHLQTLYRERIPWL